MFPKRLSGVSEICLFFFFLFFLFARFSLMEYRRKSKKGTSHLMLYALFFFRFSYVIVFMRHKNIYENVYFCVSCKRHSYSLFIIIDFGLGRLFRINACVCAVIVVSETNFVYILNNNYIQ